MGFSLGEYGTSFRNEASLFHHIKNYNGLSNKKHLLFNNLIRENPFPELRVKKRIERKIFQQDEIKRNKHLFKMNPKSRIIIKNKDYEAIEKLMTKLRKENKHKLEI